MKVFFEDKQMEVKDGINLLQFIIDNSQYGDDAVICYVNDNVYRSIDDNVHDIILKEGDKLSIFPLVIGG